MANFMDGYGDVVMEDKEYKLGYWQGLLLLPVLLIIWFLLIMILFVVGPLVIIVGAFTGKLKITMKDNGKQWKK